MHEENWRKEFDQIKNADSFLKFYIEEEDLWLQYSNWDSKIKAVFGTYENAVSQFKTTMNTTIKQ